MYWPIGAPSIYRQEVPKELISTSEDGLHHEQHVKKRDGPESLETGLESPNATAGDAGKNGTTSKDTQEDDEAKPVDGEDEAIQGVRASRNGQLFATFTRHTFTIWQTWPVAILAAVVRSSSSFNSYGPIVDLLFRPDAGIVVIHTEHGYLINYSLATDVAAKSYRLQNTTRKLRRRKSENSYNVTGTLDRSTTLMGDGIIQEVSVRFRMVIKLDAGISRAVALDDELVVVTKKPAAVQCIRWTPDESGTQTKTEMLKRMEWLQGKTSLRDLIYDRPMNLFTWITSDGFACAVQRLTGKSKDLDNPESLFKGFIFHSPNGKLEEAQRAALNSKFSLIAISTTGGDILVYNVRDYAGNIQLSHKVSLAMPISETGRLTGMHYSPDGYCLFATYETGWCTWSVYGQIGTNSFSTDQKAAANNDEAWLTGISDSIWIGGGSELLLVPPHDNRLWAQDFARSSIVGHFSATNASRNLLQTSTGILVYQGHASSDLSAISASSSMWHQIQIPVEYLEDQWPIKMSTLSPDGRYVAVAGQKGLAHYSLHSGRWKLFEDPSMENEFTVRGGMCWHQHVLFAAVESGVSSEIRLFSREQSLDNNRLLHVELLSAPAVHIASSGEDSLLVYTYENILEHFIITASGDDVRLVKVGRITLRGIIRAPPRVRAVSWIVPEYQLHHGDPSQDVKGASVILLVDGKLVFLQPATTDQGQLKYDLRIIEQSVEHYVLARDNPARRRRKIDSSQEDSYLDEADVALRDSLWLFGGPDAKVWTDVQDLVKMSLMDLSRDVPPPISIPVDFSPLSVLLDKGMLLGVEAELLQSRNTSFAQFRVAARTALFLPAILRNYLLQFDTPAALHLSHTYRHLAYFPHALEILLHNVLDEEMDNNNYDSSPDNFTDSANANVLPTVLSFLSSFPEYLDVVVQCTRKTELLHWRTLFAHLPRPAELFEMALAKGNLKTAGGYLLILHTLEGITTASPQIVRLLARAKQKGDFEICKELARFLMAMDDTGNTLHEALARAEAEAEADTPIQA